jgi:hypothetical protein
MRGRPLDFGTYPGNVGRPFAALLSQWQCGTHISTWSPLPLYIPRVVVERPVRRVGHEMHVHYLRVQWETSRLKLNYPFPLA